MSVPASLLPELEEVVQHGSAEKRAETLHRITSLFLDGAPSFNEFVLKTEDAPSVWAPRLLDEKIVGGIELSRWYPELANATLWCATELITRENIDTAAEVLAAGLVEA